MGQAPLGTATDLSQRLDAFVIERLPFALPIVREAFDACAAGLQADVFGVEFLRGVVGADGAVERRRGAVVEIGRGDADIAQGLGAELAVVGGLLRHAREAGVAAVDIARRDAVEFQVGKIGAGMTAGAGFSEQRLTLFLLCIEIALPVGGIFETMTVSAESPRVDVQSAQKAVAVAPSQNVVDLQRKATGVLPVRIDVPRAGTSHQFVKPLVVDQETVRKLRYKRR